MRLPPLWGNGRKMLELCGRDSLQSICLNTSHDDSDLRAGGAGEQVMAWSLRREAIKTSLRYYAKRVTAMRRPIRSLLSLWRFAPSGFAMGAAWQPFVPIFGKSTRDASGMRNGRRRGKSLTSTSIDRMLLCAPYSCTNSAMPS